MSHTLARVGWPARTRLALAIWTCSAVRFRSTLSDGAANITSALQRLDPSEPEGNGDIQQEPCDDEDVEDRESWRAYNGALDGVESLLLALAAEGVLTTDNQAGVDRALQATLNALENQF